MESIIEKLRVDGIQMTDTEKLLIIITPYLNMRREAMNKLMNTYTHPPYAEKYNELIAWCDKNICEELGISINP